MRYVAAYLLAVLGGNSDPSEGDIRKILSSVGIDSDEKCLKKVVSELTGKNIEELIATGREKMSSVSGGAIAVSSVSAAGSVAPAAAEETAKEVKPAETQKVESEPESDEDMGFGLFD